MFDPRITACLGRAARLLARPRPETADARLLEQYVRDRDPAAFAELLARHGPAVWALCRRLTRAEADAEDAFQATFLVLARKAERIRGAASLGSWLYGTAARITRRARARAGRTPDPVRLAPPAAAPEPPAEVSWNEVRAALAEEVARLPDVLRAPVLLCYFEGQTQDEAAAALGWAPRTVKARVARARDRLRARLTRRGIDLSAALAVPLLTTDLRAAPPHLCAALRDAAGPGRLPPGVSPAAVALARTEASVPLLRPAALLATAAAVFAAGALAGQPTAPAGRAAAQPAAAADPKLPPGGLRLGTTAFRQTGWHARAFFADGGRTVVTAGEGVAVRYWDVEGGRTVHEIRLRGNYQDAAATPDGALLAVVGARWGEGDAAQSEPVLWLIDVAARAVRHTVVLPGNSGGNSQQVRVSDDGRRAVVEYEGDVRVIDTKSGDELMRHKGRVNAGTLSLSRDGKLIAFGRYDLYLWRWDAGEEPKTFARIGGFGVAETAGFTPDGKTLLAVTDGRVAAFDVATGRQTGSLDLGGSPWKWAFSPDGRTLAAAYMGSAREKDGGDAVVLWDWPAAREVGRFPVGRSQASHVSWSADGARLAAATDYRVWAWDVAARRPLGPTSPGHEGLVSGFAFGPDGRVYTAGDDQTVRAWDPATAAPGRVLPHDGWVRGVAVSPDGTLLAGSALRNDLRVWDAATGAERFRLLGNGDRGGRREVRFTPDGKRLVAWGDDLYLRVWDVRNGKLLAEHRTLPEGVKEADLDDERSRYHMTMGFAPADLSADGSTLTLSLNRVVQVFDTATGKERTRFEADPNGLRSLALSPDGTRLAVGGRGKSIETRLPDGRTQHSSGNEHVTAVWDVAAGKAVWRATVPGSWAGPLAFSADGKRLAELVTEGEKASARVWDAGAGAELGRVALPDRGYHLAFDRTGRRLAVAHRDTTATLYDLDAALRPATPE